ncbi:MAG: GNAT family N-acetyltransferase [Dehalococcoidia bacterium]|jgi:predicted acetyltransferase
MTLEIRPVRDEELADFIFANAYAFNQDRRPEALAETVARSRAYVPLEWSLAGFLDGRLVAGMRIIPLTMRIDGAPLAMAAIGGVASLPEHRRRGHVGALLKRALADMRERGQMLSALYTPHVPLYRRYGWEIAARNMRLTFAPKEVKTLVDPPSHGQFRRVTADEWQTLNDLYEAYSAERNCVLVRSESWWRDWVFGRERDAPDAALWEDGAGRPRGYVLYYTRRAELPDRPWPSSRLWVRELATQDGDAYVALVNYLLSHDIHEKIEWLASPEEPLLSLLDDPQRVRTEAWSALMLRIVDVPAALRARGCPAQAEGRFVLDVRDGIAPWNEGTWRVEAQGGRLEVTADGGPADLVTDAATLAPIFNGHLSAREAARIGRLGVESEKALDAASAVFSVRHPPFCFDWF